MNSRMPSTGPYYIGHVKNGVIILDAPTSLTEGQAVRVEPLEQGADASRAMDSAVRIQQLQRLFAEWTEEDGKLSGEEADRLHAGLEQTSGLGFRSPKLD